MRGHRFADITLLAEQWHPAVGCPSVHFTISSTSRQLGLFKTTALLRFAPQDHATRPRHELVKVLGRSD